VTVVVKSPAISETAFLAQVLELSALLGWDAAHFRPALTTRGWRTPVQGSLGKGFPDLVLLRARDRRLILAELKSDIGKVSADQAAVLAAFEVMAGEWKAAFLPEPRIRIDVAVWRPRDFDAIAELLR